MCESVICKILSCAKVENLRSIISTLKNRKYVICGCPSMPRESLSYCGIFLKKLKRNMQDLVCLFIRYVAGSVIVYLNFQLLRMHVYSFLRVALCTVTKGWLIIAFAFGIISSWASKDLRIWLKMSNIHYTHPDSIYRAIWYTNICMYILLQCHTGYVWQRAL